MKITREKALFILDRITSLERFKGEFTDTMSNKFLQNRFELESIVESNKKLSKKIVDKSLADQGYTEEQLAELPEAKQEEVQNKINDSFNTNEEYKKYLQAEVELSLVTFNIKDLAGSKFNSELMMDLKGTLLVMPKPKAKASVK